MQRVTVLGSNISVIKYNDADFISLTDIARYKNPDEPKNVVANRIRLYNTIEYLGLWEKIHNPFFKGIEFDAFKKEAGTNSFTLSPSRWVEMTQSIGIKTKSGRFNSGTFAHKDIAMKFASWISVEFELFLIKEFQRLKEVESKSTERSVRRLLTKMNYRIHTDSIQNHLIPPELSPAQISFVYADESDMLNVAAFGITAADWKLQNPDLEGNMRDYASLEQLIILANCESVNAELIRTGMIQSERIVFLHRSSREQMKSLLSGKISLS